MFPKTGNKNQNADAEQYNNCTLNKACETDVSIHNSSG
jgi:hypothetical protein